MFSGPDTAPGLRRHVECPHATSEYQAASLHSTAVPAPYHYTEATGNSRECPATQVGALIGSWAPVRSLAQAHLLQALQSELKDGRHLCLPNK